jgi:hypothetical protein
MKQHTRHPDKIYRMEEGVDLTGKDNPIYGIELAVEPRSMSRP